MSARHTYLPSGYYSGNKFGDLSAAFFDGALESKATFDSGVDGINNDVYGEALWNQVNLKTNLFGAMPKIDATSASTSIDDPRPKTFRVAHNPPTVDDVGEGGAIPTAQTYDVEEVSATPKRSPLVMESTVLQEINAQLQDGLGLDELDILSEDYLERSIERDNLTAPVSSGGTAYADENNITSIDRVVASADEEANAQDTADNALTDGDLDVYDIDRSAVGSWADAYVDHNAASGDRQLTASLFDDFLDAYFENGTAVRENAVIVSGRDTLRVLGDLKNDEVYAEVGSTPGSRESAGDSGESRLGQDVNTRVSTWDGIPMLPVESMPSDTLSRIYVFDFSDKVVNGVNYGPKIGIENYMAPYVESAGQGQDQGFLSIGEFKNKVLYLMYHEVVCRDFGAQGKLRDLSE
ncbi:hypothetical protein Hbl1158_10130 [Halobaculum sp. CBA1158]|uniref:hypothetical protein n=1 Tax=Halobaculum sp. CBA1158 TaxID=2904243 RepID=UPI001F350BCF|nr:hypothetical protein [Halobaculum sp. CBA1158]UIO98891.1 hypothetical protein Hbl1158_10130 [Halobaculum sp. CBA1158]